MKSVLFILDLARCFSLSVYFGKYNTENVFNWHDFGVHDIYYSWSTYTEGSAKGK